MLVTGLFHCAIRTADLEATVLFYTKVLGLRQAQRPAMSFPGAWLAVPTPVGEAVIHVYAGSSAIGPDGEAPVHNEAGVVDHLSLTAQGFLAFRERLSSFGMDWREQNNNASSTWQMFVHDPNGLKIELTFDQSAEPGLPVPIPEARRYRAAERFFDPQPYRSLKSAPATA